MSFRIIIFGTTIYIVMSLFNCEVNKISYNALKTKTNRKLLLAVDLLHNKIENECTNRDSKSCLTARNYGNYNIDSVMSHSNAEKGKEGYIERNIQTTNQENSREGSLLSKVFEGIKYSYEECLNRMSQRFGNKALLERRPQDMKNIKIKEQLNSLYMCMKVSTFRQLDEYLSDEYIPLSPYYALIKDSNNNSTSVSNDSKTYAAHILRKSLLDLIVERIRRIVYEHSMKIHLEEHGPQGRGRRRDHRMFAMMMMGFVIMASILVPMGFQFLTVLGGKSLLMAKMALIMSAINGLKKIATSNVGYGLYHAGPDAFHHDPHHHGFHEKIFHLKAQEQPNSPFNVVI